MRTKLSTLAFLASVAFLVLFLFLACPNPMRLKIQQEKRYPDISWAKRTAFHKDLHRPNDAWSSSKPSIRSAEWNNLPKRLLPTTKRKIDVNHQKPVRSNTPNRSFADTEDVRAQKSRLLCYLLVENSTRLRSLTVMKTWGRRCDKLLFFSMAEDDVLGTTVLNTTLGYEFLWSKNQEALKYIFKMHGDNYDWFLKADDDTYVVVENLRIFLRRKDPKEPVYYGAKLKIDFVKQGYMSGGAGYVLSQEALRRLVTEALSTEDDRICRTRTNSFAEDVLLGHCLQSVGVKAGDSLDEDGKPRFLALSPLILFRDDALTVVDWYSKVLWDQHRAGLECCSQELISFDNVTPEMMRLLEFLIYRLHLHLP